MSSIFCSDIWRSMTANGLFTKSIEAKARASSIGIDIEPNILEELLKNARRCVQLGLVKVKKRGYYVKTMGNKIITRSRNRERSKAFKIDHRRKYVKEAIIKTASSIENTESC